MRCFRTCRGTRVRSEESQSDASLVTTSIGLPAQHEGGGAARRLPLPAEDALVQCLSPSIVVGQRAFNHHPRVAIWARRMSSTCP